MSAIYAVKCDGCGVSAPDNSTRSIRFARMNIKSDGWTSPFRGRDFCKSCSDARAERAKKENPNGYL